MKRARKIIFAIILIFSFAFSLLLGACANDKNEKELREIESVFDHIAKESLANTGSDTDDLSDPETNDLSQPEVGEHVYVVIPMNATSELAAKAQELVDGLCVKTELLTTLKYDNEHTSFPSGTIEVLVGNTNRLESQNAVSLLKQNDYVCRWDTGNLVICGGSDKATVDALEKFISEILPFSSKYSLMEKDGGFEFDGMESEAETEQVKKVSTINGYSIDEFSIVYNSENKYEERKIAEILSAVISARTGYLLDVLSGDGASKEGKTITLAVDGALEPSIESKDGSLFLRGCNGYSLSFVVEKFIDLIDANIQSDVLTLVCGEKMNLEKTSFSFDIMTYVVKKSDDADALIELLDLLTVAKEDVCVIYNLDETLYQRMSENLSAKYKLCRERNMAVFYKPSVVKSVTSTSGSDVSDFEIEFLAGEKIKYRYFSSANNSEMEKFTSKTVCFVASDAQNVSASPFDLIAQGKTTFNSKTVEYKFLSGDFVCAVNDSLALKNTSFKLSCSVRFCVNVSDQLLNLNDSLQ